MKLDYARNSRAVRVAWLLEELDLGYEIESFELGSPDMRSDTYRALHPMGRVPTLVDGDITLFESGAIIQYLLAKYGNGRFIPDLNSDAFAAYLQWFHYAEGMIMPPMNTIVVETILLPPERRNEVNVKRATKLLGQMLTSVEQQLSGKTFLLGEHLSAADFMTGHAVIMAKRLGADFSDKPNLQQYNEHLSQRPAFQTASSL